MTDTVTIQSGTPLILEQRLFSRELLDVLDKLSLEWTKISDLVSIVVWKIMWNDVSFFQKFSNQKEWTIGCIVNSTDKWYKIEIEWTWKNAEVVVTELLETSSHGPIVWSRL
jgi:hypothetical protein